MKNSKTSQKQFYILLIIPLNEDTSGNNKDKSISIDIDVDSNGKQNGTQSSEENANEENWGD